MKNEYNDSINQNPYLSDDLSHNHSFENFPDSKKWLKIENTNDIILNNKSYAKFSPSNINTTPSNNVNRTHSFTNHLSSDFIMTQDRNYLKFRNEELNKELLSKIGENQQLQEKTRSLENIVINLQKTIHGYHEKLAMNEKQKVDINLRNRRINDLEDDINILKAENIKLTEALKSKENTINEFEGLIKISKEKFALFEETNKNVKEENDKLKAFIDELQNNLLESKNAEKNSLDTIYEMKNLMNELAKKEKEYIKMMEENEFKAKENFRLLEDELKAEFHREKSFLNKTTEQYKIDNDKLRCELRNSKITYETLENQVHEKEMEFHRIVEKKDTEFNTLLNKLRDVQLSMQDLEMNFNMRLNEFSNKLKNMEENEEKLNISLKEKENLIMESESEIANFKNIFENCQKSLMELNHQLKLKDEIIERLKGQFNQVLNELSNSETTFKQYEEIKNDEYNRLIETNKELSISKERLLEERQEIIRKNELLSKKVVDLTDILESKYKRIEGEIYRERASRDLIEKANRELITKMKENEERCNLEINKMKNYINGKEKEFEILRNKLMGKLEQNRIKIEEEEHIRKSLLEELMRIKEWAMNIEKQVKKNGTNIQIHRTMNFSNGNIENVEVDPNHREVLNNIREIIKKIDGRINVYDSAENKIK